MKYQLTKSVFKNNILEMKRIIYLSFIFLSINLLHAQTLSSPNFNNNGSTSSSLSFGIGESFVGNLPSTGLGLYMGGQTASIQSVYTSQSNGLWSDPSTWNLGSVPGIGATVIIAHQVLSGDDRCRQGIFKCVQLNSLILFKVLLARKMQKIYNQANFALKISNH